MRSPRLLFLAYHFPPVNTIGAVRPFNIAKWLTRTGWEVSVVTPRTSIWSRLERPEHVHEQLQREGIRCMRTRYPFRYLSSTSLIARDGKVAWTLGRVSRRVARLFEIEEEIGWFREVERACAGLHPSDVDVILATGPPFGTFRVASRLSERFGRPFVLDYRDLWTGNPHSGRLMDYPATRRESALLQRATAVTVVSPSLGRSLDAQFGIGSKIRVVTNGFDDEDLSTIAPQEFDHFAIVYAGTFYPPKRVINPVIAALARLKGRLPAAAWKFHYYGPQSDHVRQVARSHGLDSQTIIHDLVPRGEVLSAIRGAGLSVVVTSIAEEGSLQDKSIVTGKIFEAIGFGTPCLVVAPPGSDLEEILRATGIGMRFAGSEVDKMAVFVEEAIAGRSPAASHTELYGWHQIAMTLDEVLHSSRTDKTPAALSEGFQCPG